MAEESAEVESFSLFLAVSISRRGAVCEWRHNTAIIVYYNWALDVVAFVTLLARKLILVDWKSPKSPTHKRWPEEILAHLKLEKLWYSSPGCTTKFYNVGQPYGNEWFYMKCNVSSLNHNLYNWKFHKNIWIYIQLGSCFHIFIHYS